MSEIKFTPHKQYLFGCLFFRNEKKTHTEQSTQQVILLRRNETTHKPSKVAAAKNFFSSVYVIDTNCFKCFLFHVITEKHYFS